MKVLNYWPLLIFLFLLSCSSRVSNNEFKWEKIDPEFDSITQSFEQDIIGFAPDSILQSDYESLSRRAAELPEDERVEARKEFFRGYLLFTREGQQPAFEVWRAILAKIDTTEQPYVKNRIYHMMADNSVHSPATYLAIERRLKFFREKGDNFLAAVESMDMGNFLKDCLDATGARKAYSEADSLFRLAGHGEFARLNRINLALLSYEEGDSRKATKMLRELKKDSIVKESPMLQSIIEQNLYSYTGDTLALKHLYAIQEDCPSSEVMSFLATEALKKQLVDSALNAGNRALQLAEEEENIEALAFAADVRSRALAASGDSLGAFRNLKMFSDIKKQIDEENKDLQISSLDTARWIQKEKFLDAQRKSRTKLWLFNGLFLFIICIGVFLWYLRNRFHSIRMAKLKAELEKERTQRRLLATEVVLEEKQQLIDDVGREITDMTDSGRLPHRETKNIVSAIHVHNVSAVHRSQFIESFAQIHPNFSHKLRELSPSMTETDIRLATYVALGLDNKQIASTIGIRPESVKQGRWRLRNKLELQRGESLEKFLSELL